MTTDFVHLLSYFIGIFIVFTTNVYMLAAPPKFRLSTRQHACVNIVGGLFIAYYFMHREGYIAL